MHLKEYCGLKRIDELKVIMEAAYFLDFSELKEACLCAIAVDFYIGNSEEEL